MDELLILNFVYGIISTNKSGDFVEDADDKEAFMRILILSCNTGGGHNSAAAAIKEYFDTKFAEVEIRDALAFDSRLKSMLISRGHVLLYKKAPKLFGAGYHYAEKHPSKPGNESLLYTVMKAGTKALYDYLLENRYDAVLCTHVFASMMMTEVKKLGLSDVKSYFVATDYACYPGIDEVDADAFFIAHKHLIPDYTNYGISEERLIPTGIPIKHAFYHSVSQEKAKHLLNIPEEKKVLLLMCGSMGCGPIYRLGKRLLQNLPSDFVLAVICGSNKKLEKKFNRLKSDQLIVVGFTDRMNLYMDASHLIMTKPGGLSSTEAASKAIPMVLMNVVAGCETRNLDFFLKNGFAVSGRSLEEILEETSSLLSDDLRIHQISETLRNSFSVYAAGAIGDYVIEKMTEGA